MKRIQILVAVLALAGCAHNGYREFYTPLASVTPERIAQNRAGTPPLEPRVDHLGGHFDANAQSAYSKRGYEVIGYSAFTSGRSPDDDDAADQGKKIGADIVVVIDPSYAGSVTTSVPITTPTTSTSYTNGMATAYGTTGSAVAFGNATTTTYGTNTAYVPMTVARYEYGAIYLVKVKYHVGIRMRELSDAERQQLQTNRAVAVLLVVDGSPAYESDILPGDIITAVDGVPVDGAAGFSTLTASQQGKTVDLTVVRQGRTITKAVPVQ
jgi:PDZ domain